MAIQETDSLTTVAQAKARLLELGLEAESERKEPGFLSVGLTGASVLAPVLAAIVGIVMGRRTPLHHAPAGRRQAPPAAALFGLSLGTLVKLARPLLPVVMQFLSKRRAAAPMRRAAKAQAAKIRQAERALAKAERQARRRRPATPPAI